MSPLYKLKNRQHLTVVIKVRERLLCMLGWWLLTTKEHGEFCGEMEVFYILIWTEVTAV